MICYNCERGVYYPHACVFTFCQMKIHASKPHVCVPAFGDRKQVINRLKCPPPHPGLFTIMLSAMIHRKNHHFLRGHCSTKMPGTCLCHSLWQGEFTRYRKQVVNRLKIPWGLSTLIFRRWSEVLSRGGFRGDSP